MNKCFLMTIAALTATQAVAATDISPKGGKSGSATIAFLTTNGVNTYCDTMTINWQDTLAYGSHDFQTGCGFGGASTVLGQEGKVKGAGKEFILGDNWYAEYYGQNWMLSYEVSAPIEGQGTVTMCLDAGGTPSCGTGAYIVIDDAAARPPMSHQSTLSQFKIRREMNGKTHSQR